MIVTITMKDLRPSKRCKQKCPHCNEKLWRNPYWYTCYDCIFVVRIGALNRIKENVRWERKYESKRKSKANLST